MANVFDLVKGTDHVVAESSRLKATGVGHIYDLEMIADTDNGTIVALGAHVEGQVYQAKAYAEAVLNGVLANLAEIDAKLSEFAVDWTVERMPATDRNILRIAAYEMLFAEEKIVPGVAINEAVEIAKLYGSEEAPRFINGVLGKMVRE